MHSDLVSNVQTVKHLAEYFAELKTTAIQVASTISAVDRGYFTAGEDEKVQAILVSYLQSRGALYDLINDARNYHDLPPDDRNATFLVGYAGALVLIDAARFLHDLTLDRPIVRRKLNEAVPTFDIAAGSYDRIQRSLIRTRHAWHLYHAMNFFAENEHDLRLFANANSLQPLFDIIDELKGCVDVSLHRFAVTRLRIKGDQTKRRIARTLFQRSMYGIQKFVSSVAADKYVRIGHQPQLPPSVVTALANIVEPGDVFVVRKEFAFTNYFLPGYWPHAALYVGTPNELSDMGIHKDEAVSPRWQQLLSNDELGNRSVVEAMKDGVRIRSWESPLRCDSIVVLRPNVAREHRATAIARAFSHESKRYDFDFDFGRSDRLVCTEVVYRAYEGLGNLKFPLRKRAGRPTLSGADLMEMACDGNGFTPLALYAPHHSGPALCREKDLVTQIRKITGKVALETKLEFPNVGKTTPN